MCSLSPNSLLGARTAGHENFSCLHGRRRRHYRYLKPKEPDAVPEMFLIGVIAKRINDFTAVCKKQQLAAPQLTINAIA